MQARHSARVAIVLAAALLGGSSGPARGQQNAPAAPKPQAALTLQLVRTHEFSGASSAQSLAERSLPSLLFSPGQWKEAFYEFGAESKPALMNYYLTGRPTTIERNNLYYSRSSIGHTKGIILKELAHGRIDLGIYKGRVTLDQNRIYGMGPRPVSNPLPLNNIRFFHSSMFADVDKVFLMMRFHVTLPHH